MSFRAFMNSIKEGFKGIIRHPLVTVASITTILLMLIVMSAFFIFSLNARSIMKKIGQQPPIEVYMQLNVDPAALDQTRALIGQNDKIIEVVERNPEQNYEYFKNNLGSSSSVLDSFDYNMYLPYTFNVKITDPQYADEVTSYLSTLPGVSKVAKESNVMTFLTRASSFVNIATVVSFLVLFVISLFIISNMVRISVYSRAYEIEIMKFVGATNSYIRVPFIIEGAIVGLISAGCAWVFSIIAYRSFFIKMMVGIDWSSYYALLPYKSLMWMVLILCILMGVLIGSVGSGIAVRKYVKV
ncbi:MAG: ABC transporter permease [Clostridiales bacterium]|nr:ABC transporter permease [Clostridiales bacterium]